MTWIKRGKVLLAATALFGFGVVVANEATDRSESDATETASPVVAANETPANSLPPTTTSAEELELVNEDTVEEDTIEKVTSDEDGDQAISGRVPDIATAYFRLEEGDVGDDVEKLQTRLDELGFAPGTPDGSYGKKTIASIEAFQGLVGLNVTGVADSATQQTLADYTYDGLMLRAGDEGDEVAALQIRLADGPFDPGELDGTYGGKTVQAVWALEKLAGVPVDGDWGPLDELAWSQLESGQIGQAEKKNDTRWVEVDLSLQVLKVYDPGSTTPTMISHVSSGSGIAWENEEYSGSSVTPLGDFEISRRINGWRESSLNIGRLYNPLYFNGGIAFHGATSVPLYPASHGCIRVPMHIADYLPSELPNGTAVHILA